MQIVGIKCYGIIQSSKLPNLYWCRWLSGTVLHLPGWFGVKWSIVHDICALWHYFPGLLCLICSTAGRPCYIDFLFFSLSVKVVLFVLCFSLRLFDEFFSHWKIVVLSLIERRSKTIWLGIILVASCPFLAKRSDIIMPNFSSPICDRVKQIVHSTWKLAGECQNVTVPSSCGFWLIVVFDYRFYSVFQL